MLIHQIVKIQIEKTSRQNNQIGYKKSQTHCQKQQNTLQLGQKKYKLNIQKSYLHTSSTTQYTFYFLIEFEF